MVKNYAAQHCIAIITTYPRVLLHIRIPKAITPRLRNSIVQSEPRCIFNIFGIGPTPCSFVSTELMAIFPRISGKIQGKIFQDLARGRAYNSGNFSPSRTSSHHKVAWYKAWETSFMPLSGYLRIANILRAPRIYLFPFQNLCSFQNTVTHQKSLCSKYFAQPFQHAFSYGWGSIIFRERRRGVKTGHRQPE